jgi:hypothetical protein
VDSEEELEPDNEIYCLDKEGTEEHEVFVMTYSMMTMYEPENLDQVLHATIVLQLTIDSKHKKHLLDSSASLSMAPHYINPCLVANY